MTEAEWATSNDVAAMITALQKLYADDLPLFERMLHRYYLASCRAIWKLLPDEYSRNGVEVAERYLEGHADDNDLDLAAYQAEGAAFGIDEIPEEYIDQIRALPVNELQAMIHAPKIIPGFPPRYLLEKAAYFAYFAVAFPRFMVRGKPPSHDYYFFLSPNLLREIFGNPFEGRENSRA